MIDGVRIETNETMREIVEHLERGDEVTLINNGAVVGRMIPSQVDPEIQERRRRALESLESIRKSLVKPFTTEEILELIREGRRG